MTPSPEALVRAWCAWTVRRAVRRALTVLALVTALTMGGFWTLALAILSPLDEVLRAAGHSGAFVRPLTAQGPWGAAACTLVMLTALTLSLAGIQRAVPTRTRSGHEV